MLKRFLFFVYFPLFCAGKMGHAEEILISSLFFIVLCRPDASCREDSYFWFIFSLFCVGKMCRARKIFFHTDAAQAIGKMPLDVNAMNIDSVS